MVFNKKALLIEAIYEHVCEWVNVTHYVKSLQWFDKTGKILFKYSPFTYIVNVQDPPSVWITGEFP